MSSRLLFFCSFLLLWSCSQPESPIVESIDPVFGPVETLATIKGANLGGIKEITFSGISVNFNTAYNSDNALLLRIPANVPLGEHEVIIRTEGGMASTNFRITLDPPEVFNFSPESGNSGDEIVIRGKNFFDPVEVYFFDSIQAEVLSVNPDSILARVPEGIQKGKITVVANGGGTRSPVDFFTIDEILVNDFDGNGIRSATNNWLFIGSINQNSNNAVQNSNPEPIDNNFLKLSGKDDLGISWIGGAENHSWDTDVFETFGITTGLQTTLLEMDVHNNGRKDTHIILVFLERDGSSNDFTHQIKVDGDGWQKISVPLGRFEDLNGIPIDPAKIKTLKIHLIDADNSGSQLEVNVDNIKFVEVL